MVYRILYMLVVVIVSSNASFAQGVAINETGTDPVASAMLDVTSTSKGILVPRMTTAQRTSIAAPAEGLMVYQTDGTPGFYYFGTGTWRSFAVIATNGLTIGVGGAVELGGTLTAPTTVDMAGNNLSFSNGGNIGIGEVNALSTLGVSGRGYFAGNDDNNFSGTAKGFVFAPTIDLAIDDEDTGFEVPADGNLAMYTNNVERVRITDTGYVGIGRTASLTASSKFDIETGAASGAYGGMYINTGAASRPFYGYALNGSATAWTYLDGTQSNTWKVYNGGDRLSITSGGFVGIGTTIPSQKLHVVGNVEIQSGHIGSNGTAPTIAMAGTNTGTVSVSSNSTDIAGSFTASIIDATTAGGALFTLSFNQSYSVAPIVVLTPASLWAAIRLPGFQMYVTTTTTGFSMRANQFADNSNSMIFNYMVIQSQ